MIFALTRKSYFFYGGATWIGFSDQFNENFILYILRSYPGLQQSLMSYHELQLCTCLFASRIKSCAKFKVLSWAATLQFLSEIAGSKVVGEKLSRILVDKVKVVCQKTSNDYRSVNIS